MADAKTLREEIATLLNRRYAACPGIGTDSDVADAILALPAMREVRERLRDFLLLHAEGGFAEPDASLMDEARQALALLEPAGGEEPTVPLPGAPDPDRGFPVFDPEGGEEGADG